MIVVQLLKWLLLLMEALVTLPIFYLCILGVSATLMTKRRKREATSLSSSTVIPCTNFAILIPAHNEETILHNLLESLARLAYPKDQYTVYVVADNCTDGTAELVRITGWAQVYERFDEAKRGKGYALSWLLQKLEESRLSYDAYIIFDADSVVEPNFLLWMDRELTKGARALQGCNTVLNVSESPSAALRWIALTLVNHIRTLGRNGIGGSSTLTGNGMCLSRDLLMRYPWQAFSITEDYQYYLNLVQHGEQARYVPEAIVRSHMPTTFAQMRTQDVRWEGAEQSQATWRIAWKLLCIGLRSGDFMRVEAVAELLTPQLSFLVCACLLVLTGSLLLHSVTQLVLNCLLIGGLVYYISTALYLLHPPRAVYLALLYAPGFVIWKLWVLLVLKRSKKHTREWIRTSRPPLAS